MPYKNSEKARAATRRWHHAHRERCSVIQRRYKLKQYGLTEARYSTLVIEQEGKCAICRRHCPTGQQLAVDHDHQTGKFRGLLCKPCNAGLGQFRDDTGILLAAIEYLRKVV